MREIDRSSLINITHPALNFPSETIFVTKTPRPRSRIISRIKDNYTPRKLPGKYIHINGHFTVQSVSTPLILHAFFVLTIQYQRQLCICYSTLILHMMVLRVAGRHDVTVSKRHGDFCKYIHSPISNEQLLLPSTCIFTSSQLFHRTA